MSHHNIKKIILCQVLQRHHLEEERRPLFARKGKCARCGRLVNKRAENLLQELREMNRKLNDLDTFVHQDIMRYIGQLQGEFMCLKGEMQDFKGKFPSLKRTYQRLQKLEEKMETLFNLV